MTAPLRLPDASNTYPKDLCNPNKSGQTKAERKGVTRKENQSRNLICRTEPSSVLPLKSGTLQKKLSPSANSVHVAYLGTQEACDCTGNQVPVP